MKDYTRMHMKMTTAVNSGRISIPCPSPEQTPKSLRNVLKYTISRESNNDSFHLSIQYKTK